jgi:hypothetical protein
MTTDYKPNSLARKIIRFFLVNRHLSVSADRLADMYGTTPTQVRQTLAPAVGRKIVERETNNLTGEQEYAAGRRIGEMEHLQPTEQEQVLRAEEAADQESAEAPAASTTTTEECSGVAEDIHHDAELVDITNTDMPPVRINLDELQLVDVPVPAGRTAAVSRYDGHFREALESGRAIAMPPAYVKAVADAARSWAKRHAPKHEVKSCGRLTGCHFGAIWITARKSKGRA